MALPSPFVLTLLAALLLGLALLTWRRQTHASSMASTTEQLDTLLDWPPQAVRVLSAAERHAMELVRAALPALTILAQVPLSRFIRVPAKHAHRDWLTRVGSQSVDLAICDSGSRVLAVVDVRSHAETERTRKRHERLAKVLRAAGVTVMVWHEDQMPTAAEARQALSAALAGSAPLRGRATPAPATTSRPMPLIPVADIEEFLVEGDKLNAGDRALEPVPSAFFDDVETSRKAARLH